MSIMLVKFFSRAHYEVGPGGESIILHDLRFSRARLNVETFQLPYISS